jgi:hypothetical protein
MTSAGESEGIHYPAQRIAWLRSHFVLRVTPLADGALSSAAVTRPSASFLMPLR